MIPAPQDLAAYCRAVAQQSKAAAANLAHLVGEVKNEWLRRSADSLQSHHDELLAANSVDLQAAKEIGSTPALLDRLTLTPARIDEIARGLREVATLPDPIGEVIESSRRPNGLEVSKIRVPLGVVFFIYESRPNVTADAAAICVKSGNAVILRSGKDAAHSSTTIVQQLRQCAVETGLPADAVQLVATPDHEAVRHFLSLAEFIDVAIPRGGKSLIQRVAAEARMPVIKHYTGNCHVFVDRSADASMAAALVVNSKCQRMGVCNACESLLVHADIAAEFLPRIAADLQEYRIELRGDLQACQFLSQAQPAQEADFFAEFLGPVLSVKVVESLTEAIDHINHYGSHHTDAIVTNELSSAREFVAKVDSAAIMVNASTRFNDGYQLGLGAEIGISTDKFHARGPCGLKELTSYKYVCYGTGQIRE